jgi:peptide/nickel transport system permease protein
VRQLASQRVRATGGTAWTTLVEELRPRARELRYSLHLLRGSLLAVIGLGIVVFFLVLAVTGPLLAPYRFLYNDAEKNLPPFSRGVVGLNKSALVAVGTGWNRTDKLSNQDNVYATSNTPGDSMVLRRFDLAVYRDEILFVGVNLQENGTAAAPGHFVTVSVTWDNGASWSLPQLTPLRSSDADQKWTLLEFTNATSWTAAKLDEPNFAVRIVHAATVGAVPGPVGVDVVKAVVRFVGNYHTLGTTTFGEDVLTGIILGAAISVRIGIVVVFISTLIGSLLGALSGYFGGHADELIMRITDVFLAIPGLVLALAVAAALGRNLDNVMLALIVVSWPGYTRLVRGQALSVRENTYIEAARASGASELRVITRHLIPNTLSPILVQAAFDTGTIVLVAAGLSFLGLGAQPGTPEWGLMVSTGFEFFPQNWWQVSFSGLMIFLFVFGFNLLGDGVRDIADPRLRR